MNKTKTVKELIDESILFPPMDGNHGGMHPTSDDYVEKGIPFVMASDLNKGIINFVSCKKISQETAEGLPKGFAKEGDVLLTHKATIGRTAIVKKIKWEYIMLTPQVTYYRIINNNILNNYYLKYYFDSPYFQKIFKKWAGSGSTRAYLGISEQQNLPIIYPDITTQQKIVNALSPIDSKIEINNKLNLELETMAKLIYDYWFVQFDFPNEKGKPYKSSGGKMVWNNELKREIPEGWDVGTLLDIADYINGLACQKFRPLGKESLKVIKIKEMHEGFSNETELVRPDIPEKVIIDNGDVLFSWSASLEVQIWTKGKGALNQHIFKVKSDKYPRSFYYFQLINYLGHFKMMAENRKTTMGHITQEHLEQSRVVLPPKDLTLKLESVVEPLFSKKIIGEIENQALSELRDWLLPMLMNGQVKVS